jgi:hypothetical protein
MSRIGARAALVAVALAGLGASACSQGQANRALCYDFRSKGPAAAATPASTAPASGAPAPLAVADPSVSLDDCLRRWAYSLAPSSDPAEAVARAAAGACEGLLARWNEQSLQGGATAQAPSITTGEPTNPLATHAAWAQGRALLHVVQARAGHCPAPRAKDGIPEGVTG